MSIEIPIGNLNKAKAGAGAPNFTNDRPLYAIPVDHFLNDTFPTVDEKGVQITSNILPKPGCYAIPMFYTSSTKDYTVEISGEQDAERFLLKVVASYPGDSVDATEFMVNNMGKGFVLISGKCDSGEKKVIGDICNPLYLKPAFKANKDKTGFDVTFEQSEGSRYMHRVYNGPIPVEGTITTTKAPEAIQFLVTEHNVVNVQVGTAATAIAVTSVTKPSGQIVTLVGQDTDALKVGTLSTSAAFTGTNLVLLKDGVDWKSFAGSTISFRVFRDGTKVWLIETSRT